MATTSQTESRLTAYYKWGEADFSWGAIQCSEAIEDFGIYSHIQEWFETLAITESRTSRFQNKHSATIAAQEIKLSDLEMPFVETVAVNETYWDNIGFILRCLEHFCLQDDNDNSVAATAIEQIGVEDKNIHNLAELLLEALAVSDNALREYSAVREFYETVGTDDSHYNAPRKISNEQLATADTLTHNTNQLVKETLTFDELLRRIAKIRRNVEEIVGVAGRTFSKYTDMQVEFLTLLDALLRACQGVIADVGVYHGGITLDDFKGLLKQPSGYEPFIPYVVGDYEYEKALVRLLIKAGSAGSQPAIYDAVVNVDIDDTVDRGEVNINTTSEPIKVHFNKHYYTKPEVSISLRSGNTADGTITPNITEIGQDDSGFYFMVELLKSNGTRTSGRITWTSVGY